MIAATDLPVWEILLLWALSHADQDAPTLFHSRIDGCLFPHCPEMY
jgi:hypothetical protein